MEIEISATIKRAGNVTANVSRPSNVTTSVTRIGGSATSDYEELENKPSINGVGLVGDKSTEDLLIDVGVTSVNGNTGDVTLNIPTVPTDVSAFNNDAGYVDASGAASASPVQSVNGQTGAVSLTIPTVPTDVSAFNNDVGYLTLSTLPVYSGGVSP